MERAADPIDLSSQAFWRRSPAEREESFAELRRERPLSWHGPPESLLIEADEGTGGYWAAVRHAHVREVSRAPERFCSGRGVLFDDAPPELLEASQSFLAMDAPRHTKVRGLVNRAFTPRRVRLLEEGIRSNAERIVAELAERGECDFVEHAARRLPMATIWDMMGLPEERREAVTAAADDAVAWNDPHHVGEREPAAMLFEAVLTITGAALELADARRSEPSDDLMTALVESEVDGERLSDEEIGAFFVLLAVAGNDTTRTTIAHGLHQLTEFGAERERLLADLDGGLPTAVEEMIRWASPVMTFRRTATADTELAGQEIAAGEKVVMFYVAANRDEQAFDHADRYDVLREPNHHVGFGGGGPHFCMGASLARTQLRALFGELLIRLPAIEAGEPDRLVGNFVNGIRSLPCRPGPAA